MNSGVQSPCKDVREYFARYGPEALKNARSREWIPSARTVADATRTALSVTENSIQCHHFDSVIHGEEREEVVENLLTAGGASVLYGGANVGKSFFALDLACHVVTGIEFRGMKVQQGAVVYVTLEGQQSFKYRLQAAVHGNKLSKPAPLFVVNSAVNLLDEHDPSNLVTAIQEAATPACGPIQLMIIDTLSRAMPGGDESRSVDMTTAIRAIDAIRAATGSHVMVVHHSGKDESKGARGHTSLRAAVDTEIEILGNSAQDERIASVRKQRDLAPIAPMAFRLENHEIGRKKTGAPITSCTVVHILESLADNIRSACRRPPRRKLDPAEALLILTSEIQKKVFCEKVREELGASYREAEAVVQALIDGGQLVETKRGRRIFLRKAADALSADK